MSEQASGVRNKAIPQWAEGPTPTKGSSPRCSFTTTTKPSDSRSEVRTAAKLRFSCEVLETLKQVVEEE
jgi:hypothetical protein